jgi:glutathione S-transferase
MNASADTPILWHIAISHYSEKARWALEHKGIEYGRRAALPGMHIPVALWLTRGRAFTFPILQLDGRRIGDSTAIIAALEQRFPDPPLYPADPDERRRALEFEEFFDEQLGPHARRLAFFEARRDPEVVKQIVAGVTPAAAANLTPAAAAGVARASRAYFRAFTGLRFGAANSGGADTSRQKIVAAIDRLEAELGEHDYLVGDRFTVADLTAAALLYPVVGPPDGPVVADKMPEPYERFRDTLRDRRAFRWVQEIFRRHRRAQPRSETGAGASPRHTAGSTDYMC